MGSGLFYMAAMVLKPRKEKISAKELNPKRARGMPSILRNEHDVPGLGPQRGNGARNSLVY